jgi:HD domain
LGAHYLLGEEGGWGHNPLKQEDDYTRFFQRSKETTIATRQKFQIYPYLIRTLPTEDYFYSLFGFYIFTATYASFYLLPHEMTAQFPVLYKTMQYSLMLLFTTFLAFPIWPSVMKEKHFLVWFWPLCAFYAFFVVGSILVVLSGFETSQVLIFILNFLMAVLLLHWPIAVAMAVSGIVLVVFFFNQYTSLISGLGNLGTLQFRVAYGLLLFSSFLIALFKHKQGYDLLAQHNRVLSSERKVTQQELVKALGHEARFFSEITTAGTNVLEAFENKVDDFMQQIQSLVNVQQVPGIQQTLGGVQKLLKDAMTYLQNVAYRIQGYRRLEVSYILIDELLAGAMTVLRAQYTEQQKRPRISNTTGVKALECDTLKVQQLLVNACRYVGEGNDFSQPILVGIQETTLGYPIPSIKDYIKEVPALFITVSKEGALPRPKELYMGAMGNTVFQVPQSMKDLPMLDNQRIVDAHYGTVELVYEGNAIVAQAYILPIHLREVRPSMMDLPQMEMGIIGGEVSQKVLPEEAALLKRLHDETPVNIKLVEKAILYIKKYHGYMKRKSGEPFYLHPIAATEIIIDYTEDQAAILATLLHDTIEDTPLTLSEIGVVFGPDVAAIVNKVTHLDGQFRRIRMDAHENVRQLLDESDVRVLQVKLADRLHNMRTIEGHASLEKQKKIAEETLQFFVPIARHLGLSAIEEELQVLITAVMKKR